MRRGFSPLFAALSLCGIIAGCEVIIDIPDRTRADDEAPESGALADPPPPPDAGPSPCTDFCQRAVQVCSGDYAVYHGVDDCVGACEMMGESGRQCREEELAKAAISREPSVYCHAISIGGSDACGGNCNNYCKVMARVCTGDLRDPHEIEDCPDKCAALIDRERLQGLSATASRYNVDFDHDGDTLQCRLVHLTIAAQVDAGGHCWHAALAPRPKNGNANPCATGYGEKAPRCEDYCRITMTACTDAQRVYESERQCLAVCAVLNKGNVADAAQQDDSVACRKVHAYNAVMYADPATHCPHAGPGGEQICGDDCPAYCAMLEAGCGSEFIDAFGDTPDMRSACEQECSQRKGSEPLDFGVESAQIAESNPIACGLLYAARALEDPKGAPIHCESAMGRADCMRMP